MKAVKATLFGRCARLSAAGALSAALLVAGGADAFAAPGAKPSPSASASKAAGSITVKAAPTSVKAGGKVVFTGRTKGMPIGSKLVVQHKKGNKWTSLQANATVKQGSSYAIEAKLNDKGKQELRIKADNATSPTITVTVN